MAHLLNLILETVTGIGADLLRSRTQLVAENAMLRQQVITLRRAVKRPCISLVERLLLIVASRFTRKWRDALHIVKPDTLLRWHRDLFCLRWRFRSRPKKTRRPRVDADLVALIRQMAANNRTWGSERIRGELLKLGFRVSKRTIQKYVRRRQIWACDFLQLYDLAFRPIFAFFIVHHDSRQVVHFNVTRNPTDQWAAQQLREAMPFNDGPRFLVRDNDGKFGRIFDAVAAGAGTTVLTIPPASPNCNATCERFLGTVRRECLDHILTLSDGHLRRTLRAFCEHFNASRPHQGIGQRVPDAATRPLLKERTTKTSAVVEFPVLGGLHHEYRLAA